MEFTKTNFIIYIYFIINIVEYFLTNDNNNNNV